MLGEKKSEIFEQMPSSFIPETYLISPGDLKLALSSASKIGYPIIAKPDIGERGRLVEKINNPRQLEVYVQNCPVDFLIQELVTFPLELGVFYVKYPDEEKGTVTSIVQKEFLSVIGDGNKTINDLLQANARARSQLNFDHDRFRSMMNMVPKVGEKITIEAIGNHCRGTTFLNANDMIDEQLNVAFDQLAAQIPNFYFGRFDLRCESIHSLRKLKDFKIVELNGAGSEPGHIYQPGYSLIEAYKDLFYHFKMLSQVSRQNRKRGHRVWLFREGMQKLAAIKAYNKKIAKFI